MNQKFKNIHISVIEYIITIDLKELSNLTRYKIAERFAFKFKLFLYILIFSYYLSV